MKKIIIILLSLVFIAAFPGCGCSNKSSADIKTDEPIARYMEDMIRIEPKNARQSGTDEGGAVEAAIVGHMTYRIISEKDNTLTLEITAPDMDKLIDAMRQHIDSKEDGMAFLSDALSSGNFEMVTNTVELELDENGNPKDPYALADAVYGGLLTKTEELMREAGIAE